MTASQARMKWAPRAASTGAAVKNLMVRAAANASAAWNTLAPAPRDGRFGVLMYHRVVDPIRGLDPPSINVAPAQFRRQLEGLLDRGHVFWRLTDVLRLREQRGEVPSNAVVLTFDDGFHCVHENAWPILQDLNIPATVFVCTAFLDREQPMPFDHWGLANRTLAPPESFRSMTTKQCHELLDSGLIELGAHTHTHQDFRDRPEDLREDLQRCVAHLANEFGVERPSFAFPYGTPRFGFAAEHLAEAAADVGVACGLTTQADRVSLNSDPFTWGRFNVFPWDSGGTLSARLNGRYDWAPRHRDALSQGCRNALRWLLGSPQPTETESELETPPPTATPAHRPQEQAATISIVVPTFNRAHWIGDAIASLDAQQTDGDFEFEIVVVDNASEDDTERVVREAAAAATNEVRYLHQTKPGDAPTRNCGVKAARGNWLAFFDDDQFAETDWLKELLRAAREADAHVVGGPVHLDLPQADLQRIGPLCRQALREISFYPTLQPYINNDLPGTGNALVRRDLFDEIGMFDESMTSGGSDSDFFLRAREGGYRLWYTPTAVIRHRISRNRLTPEYLRWDALSGGAGHAAHFDHLKRGFPTLLRNCLLRAVQTVVWQMPLYLSARWQGDEGQALGRRTRIWRNEGYLRKTLAVCLPSLFPQTAFFESLEFRHGRDVGVTADDDDAANSSDCNDADSNPTDCVAAG